MLQWWQTFQPRVTMRTVPPPPHMRSLWLQSALIELLKKQSTLSIIWVSPSGDFLNRTLSPSFLLCFHLFSWISRISSHSLIYYKSPLAYICCKSQRLLYPGSDMAILLNSRLFIISSVFRLFLLKPSYYLWITHFCFTCYNPDTILFSRLLLWLRYPGHRRIEPLILVSLLIVHVKEKF